MHEGSPFLPPLIDFLPVSVHRCTLRVLMTKNGKSFRSFPSLNAANRAPQIGSNLFPAIQPGAGDCFVSDPPVRRVLRNSPRFLRWNGDHGPSSAAHVLSSQRGAANSLSSLPSNYSWSSTS